MKLSTRTALAALLCLSFGATAQSYPVKPVRIIVGGPLGGPSDMPARGIGYFLGQHFNQSFVIENRAGANGILGAEACAKARVPSNGFAARVRAWSSSTGAKAGPSCSRRRGVSSRA